MFSQFDTNDDFRGSSTHVKITNLQYIFMIHWSQFRKFVFSETWRSQKKHVFKPDENMITLFKLCFRKDAIWQEKKTLQNMSQILK